MTTPTRLNPQGFPSWDLAPGAKKDYSFDYAAFLAEAPGDTIASSTWVVPTGIAKSDELTTTTFTTVWLLPSAAGKKYVCVNRIVTNQGRIEYRSLEIVCKQT